MSEEERFHTIEEVAERLRVSDRTVRRWIESGGLRAYKPGGEWRVRTSDLDAFLEARSSPKAQAPSSPEPVEDPAAYEERRAREFLSRVPSEDQRIELIERGTEICRGYVGRWVSERQYIEGRGFFPYGKSIEMETLRDRLLAALENAGMAPYANWAIIEKPGVSSRERGACANLDDAMSDMFAEIDRMRDVEQANRRSADESVPAGIKALEEELALQPRGKQHG